MLISSNSNFTLDLRFKTSAYLNEYLTSNMPSTDDPALTSSQLSHVIKDIQSLNMSSTYHYLVQHKERTSNGGVSVGGMGLNKKLLDTLSKDSGVQSNGDVDSGNKTSEL